MASSMLSLVLALAGRAVTGDIYITGEVCKALPSQAFAFAAVPANLPSGDSPSGATQISAAAGVGTTQMHHPTPRICTPFPRISLAGYPVETARIHTNPDVSFLHSLRTCAAPHPRCHL